MGKENLHFDDQRKEVVSFFVAETLACRLVFPQHFSFSQSSTRVSIN